MCSDSPDDRAFVRADPAHQIDELCDQFERSFRRREHPVIEHFLDRMPAEQRGVLLEELLWLELEFAGERRGTISQEEYIARFPQSTSVVKRVFELTAPHSTAPSLQSLLDGLQGKTPSVPDFPAVQIQELASDRWFDQGEFLIRQGDEADCLIVIRAGTVEVRVSNQDGSTRVIDESGKGEVLGEMALLTNEPRTADVVAIQPVHATLLPAKAFHQLVRQQPALSQVLSDLISQRLGRQQHDALTDKLLDRYRIRRRLGRGGMSVVYEANDTETNQRVALKMMSHRLIYNERALVRFQQEADLIERFEHPHIVEMFRRFEAFHTFFISMEYCIGQSLDQYLCDHGPMKLKAFRRALGQLASALRYAHGEGVMHRDVKPANVMRLTDGTLKLMDFGLAEPLVGVPRSEGELIGTPRYMAPEQRVGSCVDQRADVFSLGCIAYEMLTARPLFGRSEVEELERRFDRWHCPSFAELNTGLLEDDARALEQLLSIDPRDRNVDLDRFAAWDC